MKKLEETGFFDMLFGGIFDFFELASTKSLKALKVMLLFITVCYLFIRILTLPFDYQTYEFKINKFIYRDVQLLDISENFKTEKGYILNKEIRSVYLERSGGFSIHFKNDESINLHLSKSLWFDGQVYLDNNSDLSYKQIIQIYLSLKNKNL